MENTTKTDNELIAEFMGETVFETVDEMRAIPLDDLKPYYLRHQLKYDSSWDWLMPVLQHISASSEDIRRWWHVQSTLSDLNIYLTHSAVVEYIKWYNSQALESK